ncbi:DUF4159 domain-containing protein [Myxococcota bacterium]|nr:DUF4159 domain-containing protein [Myxococcota bacterium]
MTKGPALTRRQMLLGGAGAILTAPLLTAAAGPSDLVVGHLKTGGQWNPRPNGLRRLLWEVGQRTSVEVTLEPTVLEATQPQLFRHPFLYWSGSGATASFTEDEVKRLRRHLTYGGTLLVDSADAEPGGAFDVSVRRELKRILPRESFTQLPNDHVIYKSFFLVDYQAGRSIRTPYLEVITLEKRVAVIYCQNDLSGAWSRDAFGRWEYEVTPGGERQREMAFRLGINIVMYALCLDYKEDLVHVPFIMKRRR